MLGLAWRKLFQEYPVEFLKELGWPIILCLGTNILLLANPRLQIEGIEALWLWGSMQILLFIAYSVSFVAARTCAKMVESEAKTKVAQRCSRRVVQVIWWSYIMILGVSFSVLAGVGPTIGY